MNEIVMPKLSDTMTEGRIVSWKMRVGETVRRGDVLAEVETDKANMELEAFTSGVLLEIRVESGELAEVGTVIAVIGEAEEKTAQGQPAAAEPKAEPAAAAEPASKAEPAEPAAKAEPAEPAAKAERAEPAAKAERVEPEAKAGEVEGTGPAEPAARPEPAPQSQSAEPAEPAAKGAPTAGVKEPKLELAMETGGLQAQEGEAAPDEKAAAAVATPAEAGKPAAPGTGERPAAGGAEAGGAQGPVPPESRERAAPVVRRRARELDIDLSQVKGSGPEGRILLQDLEQHEAAPAEPERPTPSSPATPTVAKAAAGQGLTPFSRIRGAIAKTVSESWSSIPHFMVTMEIYMDDAEDLRRQLKQSDMPVTINDLVVKGVALALQGFPQLNASFAPGGMRLHDDINIGIAVGVPDGVLVPVVSGCQHLTLLEISKASRALVERARAGSLSEQEMSGGTFSVSNMGMYGVSQFTAIIYPSQAAVLAVGAVADAAVVRAGVPGSAKLMKVTLSADHRLADGAYAAEFLVELKRILENPVRLLV